MTASAVVLAYHDVGCRCLSVLLAHGVRIPLVVTHRDAPGENLWFGRVADLAALQGLTTVYAEDLDDAALATRIGAEAPDFLFSFYFRRMLPAAVLDIPRVAALNMHGSLLPAYRGRVPVNWAVIRGARETGSTLHHMVAKPDAGDIVDQAAVPILPDDLAVDVFRKVSVAAEIVLDRSVPKLLAGTAARTPLDLSQGGYFGGRKPEDGRIDWTLPARAVHDLVRGVAPPYPGATTTVDGRAARVLRTTWQPVPTSHGPGTVYVQGGRMLGACGDGLALPILELEVAGRPVTAATFQAPSP
jgi:methionyl-tRNA formyltransferase